MKKTSRSQAAKPDMTPMLDIVFILLIFFIVTANLVREQGLSIVRSNAPVVTYPVTEKALSIRLAAEQRIIHNGRLIDIWAAVALIKQFHVTYPEVPIAVKLEEGSRLGNLVSLLDKTRIAGVPQDRIFVL